MSLHIGYITQGDGDKPCMELHTPLVTLFDGKGQRIISGRLPVPTGKYWGKGFYLRRIDHITTDSSLQKYGIYMENLQTIKYAAELLLLHGIVTLSIFSWPVEPLDGGQPHGSIFMLGRLD
jgi:hypothetical protein